MRSIRSSARPALPAFSFPLALLACLAALPSGRAQVSGVAFHGIGDLPGGIVESHVRDATKAGGVIYAVGGSSAITGASSSDTAVVWTAAGGLVAIPPLVAHPTANNFVTASAITPDAAYIAARSRASATTPLRHAIRVTRSGLGSADLTNANFPDVSAANTISADGAVIYGFANNSAGQSQAVRFTLTSVTAIPLLSGDNTSGPAGRAASSDGSVMIGTSTNTAIDGGDFFGLGNRAFRYVHGTGVSALPLLAGGTWSAGLAVSPNGNIALLEGNSSSAPNGELYLHDATTGVLTALGTPNGSRRPSNLAGMNADATVAVISFLDGGDSRSYLRNAAGWHPFHALAAATGVNLSGWSLNAVNGISPDGTLVWGSGLHNGNIEGWVMEFPAGYLASYVPAAPAAPGAAIVGTWAAGDPANPLALLVFTADGYYYHLQVASAADAPDGTTGFERGRFTWNAATGAFTLTTLIDTNGDIGFSGADGATNITMTVSGNTITRAESGSTVTTATRVTSENLLVGAFGRGNVADDSTVVVFLANGTYYLAQDGDSTAAGDPNGRDGLERGTYTWNASSGVFTSTTAVDTNGEWGLSHGDAGTKFMSVSSDLRTITLTAPSGSSSLPRIGAAPTGVTPTPAPIVATQPQSQPVAAGGNLSLNAAATAPANIGVQWSVNGVALGSGTSATLALNNLTAANAGIYRASLSNGGGTVLTSPVIVGVTTTAKVIGFGSEVGSNIFVATNNNTFDQVLLSGASAAVTADPGQITRTSFVDLSNDIVQVEFSGAGTLSLVLDNSSGPAPAGFYNQATNYMKGHVGLVIVGADETTNVAVFSVGRITAVNQALFRPDVAYDGRADLAFIAIQSPTGKFGGLRGANASFFATRGLTGVYAPGVQFSGPVFVGDIAAADNATPVFVIGSGSDTRITGGDLFQPNGEAVQVAGLTQLRFAPGSTSHGGSLPAQANRAVLRQNDVDVTSQIVVGP